ncbi:uncharacterized protein LOC132307438 [Cornus florida]|uniref:uncharacterized protein LOC132307438 n=1 Tax=Cornus florida TaxID=4283 RepID=UPI0028A17410|nr:uncharacterized protein LOC132307438 [Cornus florida]
MSVFSSSWFLSLKLMLVSTGVVSIAMIMKVSVPLIISFAVYEVPSIWSALISWLRPPYLYVIINGIIITIAATSRFHQKLDCDNQSEQLVSPKSPPSDLHSDFATTSAHTVFPIVEPPPAFDGESRVSEVQNQEENEFVISRSTWTPPQRMKSPEVQSDNLSPASAKPLVSSRFGHRKPSPEGGRALRVAKPKRQETLENTWRTITDGRHVPLTRHLRKSDTWENHGRHLHAAPQDQTPRKVTKSETFKDRTNYYDPPSSSPGSGKLRKEPSLSQDELNRRVEAFIKKFNEEMRLQRQESLNQYTEMINRGAH